jgi:hypothetical protein
MTTLRQALNRRWQAPMYYANHAAKKTLKVVKDWADAMPALREALAQPVVGWADGKADEIFGHGTVSLRVYMACGQVHMRELKMVDAAQTAPMVGSYSEAWRAHTEAKWVLEKLPLVVNRRRKSTPQIAGETTSTASSSAAARTQPTGSRGECELYGWPANERTS